MTTRVSPRRTVLLPHRPLGNIYIRELGRAYMAQGTSPVFGPENLVDSDFVPDLLHLHWPEGIYRTLATGSLEQRIDALLASVDRLRACGTRVVWTVHNLRPHETSDERSDTRAYQGVIDRSDAIHHHCPCSVDALAKRYNVPATMRQFVVPHGNYDGYPNEISREQARKRLSIPESAFVYLHFGEIRSYKGLHLVEQTFRSLDVPHKHLLVAGRQSATTSNSRRVANAVRRFLSSNTYVLKTIEHDDVQIYMKSCDAVVLGHTDALNSGVAVLATTFGKPVVGPRLGCIDWVLDQGTHFKYEAGDIDSMHEAMTSAARADLAEVERTNRAVAATWSWAALASASLAT